MTRMHIEVTMTRSLLFMLVAATLLACMQSLKPTHTRTPAAISSAAATHMMSAAARKALAVTGGLLLGLSSVSLDRTNAFGPIDVDIKISSYKAVELCSGKKPIMPGQKAMEGLFPVCIEVEADVVSPESSKVLKDVSVYGFVKDNDAGNSVLPNNPDFKSDGGQYAMIKEVVPGKSKVTFQFVAAVSQDPKKEKVSELTFFKTKAISFPGGDKFKALDECEIDPRAQGCSGGMYDDE